MFAAQASLFRRLSNRRTGPRCFPARHFGNAKESLSVLRAQYRFDAARIRVQAQISRPIRIFFPEYFAGFRENFLRGIAALTPLGM
jgi:hypothetical protein